MELSAKEKQMFDLLEVDYVDIDVNLVYMMAIKHCFMRGLYGPPVDSLRRAYQAILDGKIRRNTEEFDDLIILEQDFKISDKSILKPAPIVRKPILDYHEMIHYIEKKYDITVRGYTSPNEIKSSETPYRDFWHHLCDSNEIHNGGTIVLYFDNDDDHEEPKWITEIMTLIKMEFGKYIDEEGMLEVYIAW